MATPPYKLGILYVVDSVIRKWREQALFHKQTTDENAADGTFGAGVYRLTTLMPSLINDVLRILPDGYKVCIESWTTNLLCYNLLPCAPCGSTTSTVNQFMPPASLLSSTTVLPGTQR